MILDVRPPGGNTPVALHLRRSRVQSAHINQPEYTHMDPENPPSIVLPIAIMIAILAACGILAMVMMILTGVITLAI